MLRYVRWALVPAILCLLAVGPADAQKNAHARKVQDQAGLFSPAAVQKADAEIEDLYRQHHKDLLIETFASAPADIKQIDINDKSAKQRYFNKWARQRADNNRVDGVYVLICKDPKYVEVEVGQRTRDSGMFTSSNRDQLAKIILEKMRAGDPDQALLSSVAYVRDNLRGVARSSPPPVRAQPGHNFPVEHQPSMNIGGWICLGIVALLVVWLIFGLIRAFTRPRGGYMGGPGGGPGGPGYGYGGGYGGGGGGFMTGLLGGMFGAVAGNWMYHNLFGGGGGVGGGWGSSAQAAGPDAGSPDAGTDVGGDYSGSGGDYDSGGGGDAGGGGGDWGGGGGGDVGGGGDWGGGGGGDWGGGGGGDFGGGGGGGGGDW